MRPQVAKFYSHIFLLTFALVNNSLLSTINQIQIYLTNFQAPFSRKAHMKKLKIFAFPLPKSIFRAESKTLCIQHATNN